MKRYRVAIVEPAPIVSEGLASMISRSANIELVGIYKSVSEVTTLLTGNRVDIIAASVLLYRQLEECSDLDDIPVIGIQHALYGEEILRKFNAIISLYSSEEDIERVVSEIASSPAERNFADSHELSDRERDVLVLVARGLTNKEIASELNISPHTVISHRKNIVHKTGIRSVAGLTVYAVLNKLIDSEQL